MGMSTTLSTLLPHPQGEQPSVEEFAATAETFAGRVHVEWDRDGLVTPLGQLPFFVEYLKQAGLFAGWVADCPLTFSSPNAPPSTICWEPCCCRFCRAIIATPISRRCDATR